MNEILIHSSGARVLSQMLSSCGNLSCDIAIEKLSKMEAPEPLSNFQSEGQWLKPAFGNLQEFAFSENIENLKAAEVAKYFGGKYHINHMIRRASQTHIGIDVSIEAGLVLDILLPLTGYKYKYVNGGIELQFDNYVEFIKNSNGKKFYHRGLIMCFDLTDEVVNQILKEQRENKDFMEALKKLEKPARIPDNFIESLKNCIK